MAMKTIPIKENYTKMPFKHFVETNIFGQYTMSVIDGDILAALMGMCAGDHLEIGTLHGGSAILCAYSKQYFKQEGNIYCVDPFPGFEPHRTPVPPLPTLDAAQANVDLHRLGDRITLYKCLHPPLPAELENMRFATCFIDGDHTFNGALADWLNVKDRVDGIIAFHDVHNPIHGVNTVFEIACRDDEWELYHRESKMGLVKRKGYEPEDIVERLEELGYEIQGQAQTKPE